MLLMINKLERMKVRVFYKLRYVTIVKTKYNLKILTDFRLYIFLKAFQ